MIPLSKVYLIISIYQCFMKMEVSILEIFMEFKEQEISSLYILLGVKTKQLNLHLTEVRFDEHIHLPQMFTLCYITFDRCFCLLL